MRVDFCGLPLDALTMSETISAIAGLVERGGAHQHVVLNAGKVVQASDDSELAEIIRGCTLVNADGMSIVWAARFLGLPVTERVTGIDLFEALLPEAAMRGWPVYFLGARPNVVERVADLAVSRFPNLAVAGWQHGYWGANSEATVVDAIAEARPRLLFVALSSPAKEKFLQAHLPALGDVVGIGVGGSFDVMAGETRRAPAVLRRTGLEWGYRLAQEPRRMARRYLVGNPRFVAHVLRCRRAAASAR